MTAEIDTQIDAVEYVLKNFRDIRAVFPDIDCVLDKSAISAAVTTLRAVKRVKETFEKDESEGYRSRDRQYVLEMLLLSIEAKQQNAG